LENIDAAAAAMNAAHETLETLADAVSGPLWDSRKSIFREAHGQLSAAFALIIQLKERCDTDEGVDALRGNVCASLLDYQLVAATILLDGMGLATIAEGEDQDFLQEAMISAEDAYTSHVSLLASVLGTRDKNLAAISIALHGLGREPREEFKAVSQKFEIVKDRLLQAQSEKGEELESQG
jgi:hypothetical protein